MYYRLHPTTPPRWVSPRSDKDRRGQGSQGSGGQTLAAAGGTRFGRIVAYQEVCRHHKQEPDLLSLGVCGYLQQDLGLVCGSLRTPWFDAWPLYARTLSKHGEG